MIVRKESKEKIKEIDAAIAEAKNEIKALRTDLDGVQSTQKRMEEKAATKKASSSVNNTATTTENEWKEKRDRKIE